MPKPQLPAQDRVSAWAATRQTDSASAKAVGVSENPASLKMAHTKALATATPRNATETSGHGSRRGLNPPPGCTAVPAFNLPEPHHGKLHVASACGTFRHTASAMPGLTRRLMRGMPDNAIPRSRTTPQGFGARTHRLVNGAGEVSSVQFHWELKLDQVGIAVDLPGGQADPGIMIDDGAGVSTQAFIQALAAHRHPQRETDPPAA